MSNNFHEKSSFERVQMENIEKTKKWKIAAALVVIIALGTGLGKLIISVDKTNTKAAEQNAKEDFFYNFDEMVVNLASAHNKKAYLKLRISVHLNAKDDLPVFEEKMPIIKDSFQTFLRELRVADLASSGGIIRLKEELFKRVNKILAPTVVKNILFEEILIT